jgi:hypothetical protein
MRSIGYGPPGAFDSCVEQAQMSGYAALTRPTLAGAPPVWLFASGYGENPALARLDAATVAG